MKKKILVVMLIVAMVCSMSACGKSSKKDSSKDSKNSDSSKTYDYDVDKLVKLGDYKGLEVVTSVTDEQVEEKITATLEGKATSEQIKKGKAKKGDTVNIAYKGTVDGKEFAGGSSEGYDLELGSGSFIPGFEDQLVGVEVGKKTTVKVTFPEDYQSADLAGKAAEFATTINYINGEKKIPELTDAYAKELNEKCNTVDEYKAAVRKELEQANQDNKGYNAFQIAYDKAEIKEYPKELIKVMKNRFDASYQAMAKSYNMEFADFLKNSNMTEESYQEELNTQSEYYAKQYMVAQAIANKEKVNYTDKEFATEIQNYVSSYGKKDEEELRTYFDETFNTNLDDIVKETLLVDKVADYLGENCKEK